MSLSTHIAKFLGKIMVKLDPPEVAPPLPENKHVGLYHPPTPEEYQVVRYQDLIDRHAERITEIRREFIYTDAEFEQIVMPLIVDAAKQLHLLPSSKEHHHHTQGGAFHHSLEVAFYSLRRSNRVAIYSRYKPHEQDDIKRNIALSFFIAGLWHDMAKPLTDLTITVNKENWIPYHETLYDFLIRNKAESYSIDWLSTRTHGMHDFYSSQMFGYFISKHKLDLHPDLHMELTNHFHRRDNVITEILISSDRDSTKQDLVKVGNALRRNPAATKIIEVIRELVQKDGFAPNQKTLNVIYHQNAIHLSYPLIFNEVFSVLISKDNAEGIPKDPFAMVQILAEAGYLAYLDPEGQHTDESSFVKRIKLASRSSTAKLIKNIQYAQLTHPFHVLDSVPEPIEIDSTKQKELPIKKKKSPNKQSKPKVDDNGTSEPPLHDDTPPIDAYSDMPQMDQSDDPYADLIPTELTKSASPKNNQRSKPSKPDSSKQSKRSQETSRAKTKPQHNSKPKDIFTDEQIKASQASVDIKNNNLPDMPQELHEILTLIISRLQKGELVYNEGMLKATVKGLQVEKNLFLECFKMIDIKTDYEEFIDSIKEKKQLINSTYSSKMGEHYLVLFSKELSQFIQRGAK